MPKIRFKIFNVPFDIIDLKQALAKLDTACQGKKQLFCITPNPEICLLARKDKSYQRVLSKADLSVADGFGILWAARYLQGKRNLFRWLYTLLTPGKTKKLTPFPERVTGTDMMQKFCMYYKNRKIFLLGASTEVNHKLSNKLKLSGVQIVGSFSGDDSEKLAPIICAMINASQAEVLFVAFGAPKQELWLDKNLRQLKRVKVAVGVGGAFDFLVGKRSRAPRWMRSSGLEWLYRLIIEPRRWQRIIRATTIFPWQVYKSR